jgi:hypothetical protein
LSITLTERFLRAWAEVSRDERAAVCRGLLGLEAALRQPHAHRGAGLRKLHPSGVWEVRIGLALRALFLVREDAATFVFLGDHDQVRRFLRDL